VPETSVVLLEQNTASSDRYRNLYTLTTKNRQAQWKIVSDKFSI